MNKRQAFFADLPALIYVVPGADYVALSVGADLTPAERRGLRIRDLGAYCDRH